MPNPLLGSAGISDQDSSSAQLSYLSPQPGGKIVVLALTIPLSFFNVGEHPMHGIETNGFLFRLNPQDPSNVVFIGVIGDGHIQLDEVSTDEGGAVSGSFEGKFLQARPF